MSDRRGKSLVQLFYRRCRRLHWRASCKIADERLRGIDLVISSVGGPRLYPSLDLKFAERHDDPAELSAFLERFGHDRARATSATRIYVAIAVSGSRAAVVDVIINALRREYGQRNPEYGVIRHLEIGPRLQVVWRDHPDAHVSHLLERQTAVGRVQGLVTGIVTKINGVGFFVRQEGLPRKKSLRFAYFNSFVSDPSGRSLVPNIRVSFAPTTKVMRGLWVVSHVVAI